MKPSVQDLMQYFAIDLHLKGLVFINDSGRGGRYKAGSKAGAIQKTGHRVVCFEGRYFPESNVVWAIHYREWPSGHVSNRNNDLQDNTPDNLYISGCFGERITAAKQITAERLRFLFSYDPATGNLIRAVDKPPHAKRGNVAGALTDQGYITVAVDGVNIRAHRIVWAIHNGKWPLGNLDHINGIRNDNRIENLRQASQAENCQNTFLRKDNTSGVKGVSFNKELKKYTAFIQANKAFKMLGHFDDFEDAVSARRTAELAYHPFRKAY